MRVQPTEIDDALNNPWMGWGLFATRISQQGCHYTVEQCAEGFGDDAPLFDWIMLDWMWADLEPQEGSHSGPWGPLLTDHAARVGSSWLLEVCRWN